MSNDKIENLRQKYWQLEDEIKQGINRNKTTIILSFTCAALLISSIALLGYGIEQHASRENYRIKFENKDAYTKELEQQYKDLQYKYETLKKQADLSYNYDTGNFSKNVKPDKKTAFLRSLPNIYIPPRSSEPYIPIQSVESFRPQTVYIETEKQSSLPVHDIEAEQREWNNYKMQKTVENMKLDKLLNTHERPSLTSWEY